MANHRPRLSAGTPVGTNKRSSTPTVPYTRHGSAVPSDAPEPSDHPNPPITRAPARATTASGVAGVSGVVAVPGVAGASGVVGAVRDPAAEPILSRDATTARPLA